MSNIVYVEVGEFVCGGGTSYGYVASDSYASTFNFSFNSWDEFYKKYPTVKELWTKILDSEGFMDIEVKRDKNDKVVIEKGTPVNAEPLIPISFELTGFDTSKEDR